jgi:hypothetical protein
MVLKSYSSQPIIQITIKGLKTHHSTHIQVPSGIMHMINGLILCRGIFDPYLLFTLKAHVMRIRGDICFSHVEERGCGGERLWKRRGCGEESFFCWRLMVCELIL